MAQAGVCGRRGGGEKGLGWAGDGGGDAAGGGGGEVGGGGPSYFTSCISTSLR
jgi:hypothetical protein